MASASRPFPFPPPSFSPLEAAAPPPPNPRSPSPGSASMGSTSSPPPPPPPMIGRAGNLTVFITPPSHVTTPRASRLSESPRSGFSTPVVSQAAVPPSPSPRKTGTPPAPSVSPPLTVKVAPPPVQVPPPRYEKASTGGKHDGSAFGFFWDAVTRVQEAHASLDEYVANWFGLDQSKYQWALNDYYENTGKNLECGKVGKPKELSKVDVC